MPDSFYEITSFSSNGMLNRTVLMISMEHSDWCEFEKTPLYKELIEYLDQLENRR